MRIFVPIFLLAAVFAAATAIPNAKSEALQCVPRSEFLEHLEKTFAEKPVALGVADNGAVTELLHNQSGDSWTIIMTTPEGLACRIAAGKHWRAAKESNPPGIRH